MTRTPRRSYTLSLKCALLFCAIPTLFAQSGAAILGDPIASYQSYGATATQVIPVADATVPFVQAVQMQLDAPLTNAYQASVLWYTVAPVASGDFLLVSFWVKNLNPSSTPILRLEPKFQIDANPYSSDLDGAAPADGSAWRHYAIPVRASYNYTVASPTSSLQVFFGTAAQTFAIGGVSIVDYGPLANPIPTAVSSQFDYYYPGRGDPNAYWRATAASNIEQFRKSNVTVQVRHRDGTPAASAQVSFQETNPAFHWGSAIDSANIVRQGNLSPPDQQKYIQGILDNFNFVVFENDLKWPNWEFDRQLALDGIAWVQARGLQFRGHNLVWPSWGLMPSGLMSLSPADLSTTIDNHLEDELGTLKNPPVFAEFLPDTIAPRQPVARVSQPNMAVQWDVVNEPYGNTDVQGLIGGVPGIQQTNGVLGNASIAGWYKLARQIDSKTLLFVNDAGIFENKDPLHEAYDLALVKYIQSLGGEIDGIGFESHFGQGAPVFTDMDQTQADFGPVVKEFGVTEFDFTTLDPALQTDLTTDYLTYVFGSPQIHEFLMWGFWDGAHWLNSAPIYNLDWSLKPSGMVFQQLTQKTWRTNTSGAADINGNITQRVFQGTYTIRATVNGAPCSANAEILTDTTVTVTCP